MKIQEVKVRNFKGIEKAELDVKKENTIIVCGKNGAGKSSLLDAIKTALAGKDKALKNPVKNGSDKSSIILDLGDYIIKRTTTLKTDKLDVMSKDGAHYPKPQAMLDNITEKFSFDPGEFAKLNDKEQKESLMKVIGLDFTAEDERRLELYNERVYVGRRVKEFKVYPEDKIEKAKVYAKKTPVSLSDVTSELETGRRERMEFERAQKAIKARKEEKELYLEKIAKIDERNKKAAKIKDTKIDIEKIEKELLTVEEENKKINYAKGMMKEISDLENENKKYKELSNKIKEIDKIKSDKLEKAKVPVKGLSIKDSGVELNDVPVSQLSTSEQLKVGISMLAAKKSKLPVLFVKNGNDLDQDNLKVVNELAKKFDMQIFVECVREDSDTKVGVSFFVEGGKILEK